MKKKMILWLLAVTLCGNSMVPVAYAQEMNAEKQQNEEISPEMSNGEKLSGQMPDASMHVADIMNATIDASIYLDYSAGIEDGVYQWILSEDGTYFTLCSVDENGDPISMEQSAINVGANNGEAIDMGKGDSEKPDLGGPEEAKMDMNFGGPQRDKDGMVLGGPKGDKGGIGHGGMMGGGSVYQGIYINSNITNTEYQTMLVYVPAAYFTTDANGKVNGINEDAVVGVYTASTAPIVFLNECGGWKSSQPKNCDTSFIEQGMIYVTCGARSRDAIGEDGLPTGKAPTQMVDLKSGVIQLRANADVIPGNTEQIISYGASGGGQMSSALGASGDMSEYYPYMAEAGVLGVSCDANGDYTSVYPDHIYASQCYCPIADIENADLAYAWWWVDLIEDGGTRGEFTAFDTRLQELEAEAFVTYINNLDLHDQDGNPLMLTSLRSGSYYDAVLENISSALNAMVMVGEIDPKVDYTDTASWLEKNEKGEWKVTDLRGFMIGTGLVNQRNKAVPGFDTMDESAENNAFGTVDEYAVHYSASVATILQENYEELSKLDGFNKEQVDDYISDALTGENAAYIENQTNLLNATEIMLGSDGLSAVTPAEYWRVRSGTADQHTSFSVGYNICLAAQSLGLDTDYHLVWNMGHGSNEGDSTGTFIDWINEICK